MSQREESSEGLKALFDEAEAEDVTPDADDATAVTGNQQAPAVTEIPNDGSESEAVLSKGNPKVDSSRVETSEEREVESSVQPDCTKNQEEGTKAIRGVRTETAKESSSFAKLVKTWETYIADAHRAEHFQPMQMLQNLRLCGPSHDVGRLTLAPSTEFASNAEADPFEPIVLRHTHSTPLQYRPSFFNDYDNGVMPPPSQFDPTRRSSSTPSRGSAFQTFNGRSAFGRYFHTGSNLSNAESGRSAFGFPLQRSSFSVVSTESNIRNSAFDPVAFVPSTSTIQEEPHEENTSIEVMDLGHLKSNDNGEEQKEIEVEIGDNVDGEAGSEQSKPKESAAARAARFLSDVGVLRRKKKGARSSVVSSVASTESDITIKVQDKTDSKDKLEVAKEAILEPSKTASYSGLHLNCSQGSESHSGTGSEGVPLASSESYQQLDSDVDEEFVHYQKIGMNSQPEDESSSNVPLYHRIEDDCVPATTTSWEQTNEEITDVDRLAVRIQVSCNAPPVMPQVHERVSFHARSASSPSPCQMVGDDAGDRSPDSETNSPGTSGSTTTSGHTTQATSTTSNSGNTSRISETDREVMEAIKEGKRRCREEIDPAVDKNDSDRTVGSSSTDSTATNGYLALSGSPTLRDGASVVADRFFKNSRSPVHGGYPSCYTSHGFLTASFPFMYTTAASNRAQMSTSGKNNSSGSPTSSSLNSLEENPPKFVSYLDRQAASDLTSLRETNEATSCRGEVEEREDSPAEIIGYPAIIFEEAKAEDDEQNENAMSTLPKLVLPTKERLYSMLDRFRSRPPRSPAKGMRTRTPTTPPPHLGSPQYHHQVSPPRNIIDHTMESNVSRPYVVRTNPSTQKLVLLSPGSSGRPVTPLLCVPVGSPNYSPNLNRPFFSWQEHVNPYYGSNALRARTYEERSIEIMKTESKDDLGCQRFATPSPENVAKQL